MYSKFNLERKVALVTGGNSGIGLGYAEALAEAGAAVCIWGTNEKKNAAALETLKAFGKPTLALKCDVGNQSEVKECFAKTVAELGRVDACFANAGVGGRGTPFAKITDEEWHAILRVNLDGVFYTFQEAVKHMKERGEGGSLVATSSTAAIFGAPRSEHYAASKAGVISIVRALAVEHARDGIRANAVLPGWIRSAMTDVVINSEPFKEKVLPRIPQRRWGEATDFGGIAVYLASDASAYHSGDTIRIDGAYTCF